MRFTSLIGAMKYSIRSGTKVGISSNRIPMAEFENFACVRYWREPLKHPYPGSECEELMKEVVKFINVAYAYAFNIYDIKHKPQMVHLLCGHKSAPLWIALGNKSLHVVLPLCLPSDKFRTLYMILAAESWKYADRTYLEMVQVKGYATLRLLWKPSKALDQRKVITVKDLVMPVAWGKLIEGNMRFILDVNVRRSFYDNWLILAATFRQIGFDVVEYYA